MSEATQYAYGTPYPETGAVHQDPGFSRFPGVDPVTIPGNDYATPGQAAVEPEVVEPETAKPYTLKRLQSRDVFPMLRILSKIGVAEMKECFSSPAVAEAIGKAQASGKDADLSSVGVNVVFEIAGVIVNNIPKCEQDIYAFLAQLSGMGAEDIANMDAVVFFEMIVDVIKKPEFKDFMKVVSGLLK